MLETLFWLGREEADVELPGRVSGIDYGTVRLGIAISDAARSISSPYENYRRQDDQKDAQRFQRLVSEEEVVQFVVGLPVHTSGQESQKSREAREFGSWLTNATGVPVDFVDERFTTQQAEQALLGAGLTNQKRKARRDMLAAQILLQTYLDHGAASSESLGALDDTRGENGGHA